MVPGSNLSKAVEIKLVDNDNNERSQIIEACDYLVVTVIHQLAAALKKPKPNVEHCECSKMQQNVYKNILITTGTPIQTRHPNIKEL